MSKHNKPTSPLPVKSKTTPAAIPVAGNGMDVSQNDNIRKLTAFLKDLGVPQFILIFPPVNGVVITHIEKMPYNGGFDAIMACYKHLVELYVSEHPFTELIFKELLADFYAAVEKSNKKLVKIDQHSGGKPLAGN